MANPAGDVAMLMTPDEFLVLSLPDGKAELVRGEVRLVSPAGGPHGRVATNLVVLLANYVRAHVLGEVLTDGVGYELVALPRTVRAPDLSFVRAARLPVEGFRRGFQRMAPDLAVEVLSPDERASELQEKLDDYRTAGTPLLWVVDPERRTVVVHRTGTPSLTMHEVDSLDAGDVIPGFACRVSEIFEGIARDL